MVLGLGCFRIQPIHHLICKFFYDGKVGKMESTGVYAYVSLLILSL